MEALNKYRMFLIRHSGESRNPVKTIVYWMPFCNGMTAMGLVQSFLKYIVLIMAIQPAGFLQAEELGRLFTTPEQRNSLERERDKKPEVVFVEPVIVLEEEPIVEEAKPEIGGITLNGLVYRKNGKSTAWVNNANSYEGNLGNQYIQIDARNIDPEKVVIQIPVAETSVKLKAGETYNPGSVIVDDSDTH